jgi:hypothetical protein
MASIPPDELPEHWRPEGDAYAHAYLECRVRIDAEPYRVAAAGPDGEWRTFLPPDSIGSEAEARDWALAVMANVDSAYGPDCADPVGAALARTWEGNDAWAGEGPGGRPCLLCGADLALFGDDAFAGPGYEAHLRYVEDDAHDRALSLLEDPYSV